MNLNKTLYLTSFFIFIGPILNLNHTYSSDQSKSEGHHSNSFIRSLTQRLYFGSNRGDEAKVEEPQLEDVSRQRIGELPKEVIIDKEDEIAFKQSDSDSEGELVPKAQFQCRRSDEFSNELQRLLQLLKKVEIHVDNDVLKKEVSEVKWDLLKKFALPVIDFDPNYPGKHITKFVTLADLIGKFSLMTKDQAIKVLENHAENLVYLEDKLIPLNKYGKPNLFRMKTLLRDCWPDDFANVKFKNPERYKKEFLKKNLKVKDGLVCEGFRSGKELLNKKLEELQDNDPDKFEELIKFVNYAKLHDGNSGFNGGEEDCSEIDDPEKKLDCSKELLAKYVDRKIITGVPQNEILMRSLVKLGLEEEFGDLIGKQIEKGMLLRKKSKLAEEMRNQILDKSMRDINMMDAGPFERVQNNLLGRRYVMTLMPQAIRTNYVEMMMRRRNPQNEGRVQLAAAVKDGEDENHYEISNANNENFNENEDTERRVTYERGGASAAIGEHQLKLAANKTTYENDDFWMGVQDHKYMIGNSTEDGVKFDLYHDGGYWGLDIGGDLPSLPDTEYKSSINIAVSLKSTFNVDLDPNQKEEFCKDKNGNNRKVKKDSIIKYERKDGRWVPKEENEGPYNVPLLRVTTTAAEEKDFKLDLGVPGSEQGACPFSLVGRFGHQKHKNLSHTLCLPMDEAGMILKDGSQYRYNAKMQARRLTQAGMDMSTTPFIDTPNVNPFELRENKLPSVYDPLCCNEDEKKFSNYSNCKVGEVNARTGLERMRRNKQDKREGARKIDYNDRKCLPLDPYEKITYSVDSYKYIGGMVGLGVQDVAGGKVGGNAARSKSKVNVTVKRTDLPYIVEVTMAPEQSANYGYLAEVTLGVKASRHVDLIKERGMGAIFRLDLSTPAGMKAYMKMVVDGRTPLSVSALEEEAKHEKKFGRRETPFTGRFDKKGEFEKPELVAKKRTEFLKQLADEDEILRGPNPLQTLSERYGIGPGTGVEVVKFDMHERRSKVKTNTKCKVPLGSTANSIWRVLRKHFDIQSKVDATYLEEQKTGTKARTTVRGEATETSINNDGVIESHFVLHGTGRTRFFHNQDETIQTVSRLDFVKGDVKKNGEREVKSYQITTSYKIISEKDNSKLEKMLKDNYSIDLDLGGEVKNSETRKQRTVTIGRKFNEKEINALLRQLRTLSDEDIKKLNEMYKLHNTTDRRTLKKALKTLIERANHIKDNFGQVIIDERMRALFEEAYKSPGSVSKEGEHFRSEEARDKYILQFLNHDVKVLKESILKRPVNSKEELQERVNEIIKKNKLHPTAINIVEGLWKIINPHGNGLMNKDSLEFIANMAKIPWHKRNYSTKEELRKIVEQHINDEVKKNVHIGGWYKDPDLRKKVVDSIIDDKFKLKAQLVENFIGQVGDKGFGLIQGILNTPRDENGNIDFSRMNSTNHKLQVKFYTPWDHPLNKSQKFIAEFLADPNSVKNNVAKAKTLKDAFNRQLEELERYPLKDQGKFPRLIDYDRAEMVQSHGNKNYVPPSPIVVKDETARQAYKRMCCYKAFVNKHLNNLIYTNREDSEEMNNQLNSKEMFDAWKKGKQSSEVNPKKIYEEWENISESCVEFDLEMGPNCKPRQE